MLKTNKFDIINYLKTEKDIDEYLEVFFDERDYEHIPLALADIERARKAMATAAKVTCRGDIATTVAPTTGAPRAAAEPYAVPA
jgi:DNA-binding phage protein